LLLPKVVELLYQQRKGLKMAYIMTVALVFTAFYLGRKSSYHNGYIAGRRELRRQYEKANR